MKAKWSGLVVTIAAIAVGPAAAVDIETVPVGNPGNAGEWSGESYGRAGPGRKSEPGVGLTPEREGDGR